MDMMGTMSLAISQTKIQLATYYQNPLKKITTRFAYFLKVGIGFWINISLANIVRQNTLKNISKKSCCDLFLPYQTLAWVNIMLKETKHLKNIITAWRKAQVSKILINSWRVHILASNTNRDSEKFYIERSWEFINIYPTSRKYIELDEKFRKLQVFENENTNQEKIIQEEIKSAVAR